MAEETSPAGRSTLPRPDLPYIRAEQTRLLMDGVRSSVPASITVAGVLAYIQWPVVEHSVVIVWLCVIVLVSLIRGALALAYFRTGGEPELDTKWLRAFVAGTILAGGVWGAGAWLLYPPDAVAHQAFLGVLVAGIAAGAVSSLSASLTAGITFLSLALAPLAVRFLSSDEDVIFALGVLTILFTALTMIGVRRMNASILQNVRLHLQSNARVAALRNSEERARKLSMVASRTDNAVIITDEAGRVEWVNDGFTRIAGYSLREVIGRTPGSVLQGPDTDLQVVRRMRERLHRGEGFEEDILNYAKDGRPYWISIEVQPIKDDAGKTVQFMGVERDITESRAQHRQLEEARRKAEEASNVKSTFLAMMSHEVRTPLNGVLGSLSLLEDTALDAEQRKFVETSRRSAEWLLSIINNILDFSKMEAGKIELEPAVFNVSALVDSVVEILEPRASEKAISILANVDPAVPLLAEGDSTKIRQVLLNLAGNGVKFTSRGEVCINVSLLDRSENLARLRFSVTDTGAGIAKDQQAKIFEEFWTRSEGMNHGIMGTGLGLSISRRLVQLLGGEIAVTSQKGAGSSFWFDIPVTVLDADAAVLEQARLSRDRHGLATAEKIRLKGRVLIAEDNPANQMIAQSMLTRLGLSVDVAANGLEALDALRTRPYDLVLMDIGMPEMDGIEATRKIRAMGEPTASIPVIAVTAHVMRGERESLRVQGLDDYLAKPIDRTALLDCLRRWLKQEEDKVAVANQLETPNQPQDSTAVIDRAILDRLLDDVGPENAKAVIGAFIQELELQKTVLEGAAVVADLDAMSQAAHRLKSSAASFGASRLSRLAESIEQAAKAGNLSNAAEHMREFPSLSKASLDAMHRFRDEVFGPGS